MARGLGRQPRFVIVDFRQIDQSIARGDADIGLSGIEDTPARRTTHAVTVPYYEFREVLAVRDADASRFRTLADLRDKNVGTLGGTIAYEILLRAERDHGIHAVSYDDDVHPYSDLVLGRLDAVLLDNVLAERRDRVLDGFTVQPETVAVGHYVGVFASANAPLRDTIDEMLRGAMRDGTLERIFRKWRVWNDDQPKLYAQVLAGAAGRAGDRARCIGERRVGVADGRPRGGTCRRCCARRRSRSRCRACRWRSPSRSASSSRPAASTGTASRSWRSPGTSS